jgi:hypothetical protein
VVVQSDRIELVLQPGESGEAEFEDGQIPPSVVQARFRLVKAEPLQALVAKRSGE